MTIEQLRRVHQAYPFVPFTIRMADGRSFYIGQREWLAHSPSGRTTVVLQPDDSFSILDLLLMTEVQVLPTPSNGPPRTPSSSEPGA
jgi:hypothetical protein